MAGSGQSGRHCDQTRPDNRVIWAHTWRGHRVNLPDKRSSSPPVARWSSNNGLSGSETRDTLQWLGREKQKLCETGVRRLPRAATEHTACTPSCHPCVPTLFTRGMSRPDRRTQPRQAYERVSPVLNIPYQKRPFTSSWARFSPRGVWTVCTVLCSVPSRLRSSLWTCAL